MSVFARSGLKGHVQRLTLVWAQTRESEPARARRVDVSMANKRMCPDSADQSLRKTNEYNTMLAEALRKRKRKVGEQRQ